MLFIESKNMCPVCHGKGEFVPRAIFSCHAEMFIQTCQNCGGKGFLTVKIPVNPPVKKPENVELDKSNFIDACSTIDVKNDSVEKNLIRGKIKFEKKVHNETSKKTGK